jgi:hypothetical protein
MGPITAAPLMTGKDGEPTSRSYADCENLRSYPRRSEMVRELHLPRVAALRLSGLPLYLAFDGE